MDKQTLFYEYEQILLGNRAGFSPYYFKYGGDAKGRVALAIIRFAAEHYLRYDPFDMKDHFTKAIAIQMKLEPIMKYVTFPPELDRETDYFYLAALLYPNVIQFDTKGLVLRTYKQVLNGTLCKFPKEYLSGAKGMVRASICLQYMLNQNYTFSSIRQMYVFFAGPEGAKALKKHRLSNVCSEVYGHPLDYLHESLPLAQQDPYWYHYYRFLSTQKKQETGLPPGTAHTPGGKTPPLPLP